MNGMVNHIVSLFCVLLLTAGANAGEPGLVGWWTLDDGAGSSVADSSGLGHDGSFITGTPVWVQGKFGGALQFEGTAQVEVPDHADFHIEDAVSIALWANPAAVQLTDAKFFVKQKSTYYPYAIQYDSSGQTVYANVSTDAAQFNTRPNLANFPGEWAHLCSAYDGSALILYKNGVEVARVAGSGKLRQNTLSLTIGGRLGYTTSNNFTGMMDDVRLYNRALTPQDIQQVMQGPPAGQASAPSPAVGAVDVPRSVTLRWTPGELADRHNVYFGTNGDDVKNADTGSPLLVGRDLDVPAFAVDGLEFGQICYWRVDEIGAPPDNTVFKGGVWSFNVEPLAIPIDHVTATASSQEPGHGPANTVNQSGLTEERHSTGLADMWLSSASDTGPAWIQYEFDKAHKLHEMSVWNYNGQGLNVIYGLRDVAVEYSADGADWVPLSGVTEFPKASGTDSYTPSVVDLGNAIARYVKITAVSNWSGGLFNQCGLSEVRFTALPVWARKPDPAAGATGVAVDVTLGWRAGREAAGHNVYLSDDLQAVTDGTAPVVAVNENSFGPLDLDLGTTWYWRVDEVNETALPALWRGEIWSFSSTRYLVVDDFESYNDEEGQGTRIYETWTDGWTDPQKGGSQVGYTNPPFAEQKIIHGGKQSMPLLYDNTGSSYSEAERTWKTAQNWAGHGADTLTLYFRGIPIGFLELSPTHILMNGVGTDIFSTADQGRFVYKQLSGDGTIIARVDRLDATDPWAKAGVMIRQSVDAGAPWAMSLYAPGNGFRFQTRVLAGGVGGSDSTIATPEQIAVRAPVWIKLERKGNQFNAYYAAQEAPATWIASPWNPQTVTLSPDVCIGLAVTSHAADLVTQAEFSNITTTGSVTGNWQSVSLGIEQPPGNLPDAFYVTIEDRSGHQARVLHADPNALVTAVWTAWDIALSDLRSAGVKTDSVTKLTIGIGDKDKPASGAAGLVYIDDIRYGRSLPQ
jgi:hypothetical protein